MAIAKSAEAFFHGYAHDFNAIYDDDRKQNVVTSLLNRTFRKSMLLRYRESLARCSPIEGKSVLDIGSGPGHYTVALAEKGAAKVVSMDPADGMLEIAKERAKNAGVLDRCEFVKCMLQEYEPAEKFNYSIAMGVMDYILNPLPFLEHVFKITSDKAMFSFPSADGLLAIYRRQRYKSKTPLKLYERYEIEALLEYLGPRRYDIQPLERDFFVEVAP